MHSLDSVLILAGLFASAAWSSPTPAKPLQKRSFVHHVRRSVNVSHPAAGGNAMFHAYRKHGLDLGERKFVAAGAVSRAADTGQVAANPSNNAAEYVSPVIVGGTTLVLDFDTGSSDL
jgi:hypothetical protein